MNKPVVIVLLVVSVIVTVTGEIARQRSGWGSGGYSMIGAVFAMAFARMLFWHDLLERKPIKLGSETLPASKDVAAVLVQGKPISDEAKKNLLKANRRAKRSTKCGSVSKELSFEIIDHWGGVWNLQAYEEVGGVRGFSANRVVYAGRAAAIVASCAGI